MGEYADAWSAKGQPNVWGVVPDVTEMQSEAGAAGALHGALTGGALTTTFTASQGLLLKIPNMFKIAGELTPAVIHVAARSIATHALSIFGDHSDVMAARSTGFALLCSHSVQEAQDMALVAHSATLRSRVPFMHFFDGFRTSSEVSKIELVSNDVMLQMMDMDRVFEHRMRALNPNHPVLRGSAQNPDVFFQAREACNQFYEAVPEIVQKEMDKLFELTGRRYHLFDYVGDPKAERVVILMGSGVGAAREAVEKMNEEGEKVGLLAIHLFRPFSLEAFKNALPETAKKLVVLDRTKEPGATGEPLYQEIVTALSEIGRQASVIGGRYGLSSKEFTPPMVVAALNELNQPDAKKHFTVGIRDDVTHLSLEYDDSWEESKDVVRAVFHGLGADGTVGANKNSVKIIGDNTKLYAQGYFVYDSKKSGSRTVSHLRFGPRPINSTYLVSKATFLACHQWNFLSQFDVLAEAAPGATFLINSPYGADEVWEEMPLDVRNKIISLGLEVYVIDAARIARDAGLGGRVNTVLQTAFFVLSKVLPKDEAIAAIKEAIKKTYGKRGETVVAKNMTAVDAALSELHRVEVPEKASPEEETAFSNYGIDFGNAPDFVQKVTAVMMAGKGDLLPVSAMPVDGTFPTGTTQWEKRSIAPEIPIWDPELCIDCARCALVCPHAAIRIKAYDPEDLPDGLPFKEATGKEWAGKYVTIQVAPDDCTGCGVCVDICPGKSKEEAKRKAINMEEKLDHLEIERKRFADFLMIPDFDRSELRLDSVKGSQLARPLFEFSGACAGCGETPYVKLMSQMFGDRAVVANATGCSSIYGGNLPTTPWTTNEDGRGPAWSNSLFEDNAEFGLGMRLAYDALEKEAKVLVQELASQLGDSAEALLSADQSEESGIAEQRDRVETLKKQLAGIDSPSARRLEAVAEYLVKTSVWIIGGDGWAYDIGFGGLDHVFASGRNVNILVLDTEVYSNTGGQASKATPRAAVAKFAAGGKLTGKKDLGQIAMSYGNVYVAQVAMGANMNQVVKAFAEAEAHPGVSLIIAYSPCIAHGIEMQTQMTHQKEAAESGYWPLFRYDPAREERGEPGLRLDSRKPTIPFSDYAAKEVRFSMLQKANPKQAEELFKLAQQDIDNRWNLYEQMVNVHRTAEFTEMEE